MTCVSGLCAEDVRNASMGARRATVAMIDAIVFILNVMMMKARLVGWWVGWLVDK